MAHHPHPKEKMVSAIRLDRGARKNLCTGCGRVMCGHTWRTERQQRVVCGRPNRNQPAGPIPAT